MSLVVAATLASIAVSANGRRLSVVGWDALDVRDCDTFDPVTRLHCGKHERMLLVRSGHGIDPRQSRLMRARGAVGTASRIAVASELTSVKR
jgi:hypothetical protein